MNYFFLWIFPSFCSVKIFLPKPCLFRGKTKYNYFENWKQIEFQDSLSLFRYKADSLEEWQHTQIADFKTSDCLLLDASKCQMQHEKTLGHGTFPPGEAQARG